MKKLYLIGAPKCGTTSVIEAMRLHKEIYIPIEKELYYLSGQAASVSAGPSINNYKRFSKLNNKQYLSLMRPKSEDYLFSCDGSTDSLYFANNFISKIDELGINRDECFIVAMVRNPEDAIKSRYIHNTIRKWENLSLLDALNSEKARRQNGWSFDFDYRGQFNYSNIQILEREFSNILIIQSEDYFKHEGNTLIALSQFMGLSAAITSNGISDPSMTPENIISRSIVFQKLKLLANTYIEAGTYARIRSVYKNAIYNTKAGRSQKDSLYNKIRDLDIREHIKHETDIYQRVLSSKFRATP